jgi:hypothetical protein
VYTVQAAYGSAVADVVVSQTESYELPGCDHTVLLIGQFRDHTIGRSRFPGIISGFFDRHGVKSPGDPEFTPSTARATMGVCR